MLPIGLEPGVTREGLLATLQKVGALGVRSVLLVGARELPAFDVPARFKPFLAQ